VFINTLPVSSIQVVYFLLIGFNMKKYLLASALFVVGSTGVSAMMMPGMMGMGGMGFGGMGFGGMGGMPGMMGMGMPGMMGMGMGSMMPGMMGMGMTGMMGSTNAGKAEIEKIKNSDLYQLGSGLLAMGAAIYGKVSEVATYILMETMANQYRQQMSAYQSQMPFQSAGMVPNMQYAVQQPQYAVQPQVQYATAAPLAAVAPAIASSVSRAR
jgi:hypothetical protein